MKTVFEWMTRAIGQRLRTLYADKQRPLNWAMIDKVETLHEAEMAAKAKAVDAKRDRMAKEGRRPRECASRAPSTRVLSSRSRRRP